MSAVLNIHAPSVEITVGTIPEGKVIDFLTGQPVNDTAEEYVRQNIEKALVRQYQYNPAICLPEFPIKVGSGAPKRVDIVAFDSQQVPRNQENAHLLVETKRSGSNPAAKKDGIDQLKSYMAACLNAKYGLWTNGEDRFVFAKRFQNKSLEFEEIVDIPIFGQSEEEAQRPKRKDLMPATADNLLFAFRRCHNYIAGTEGMQKQDAFWELLKLIFCKIEDERSGVLQFYVTPAERSNTFAAGAAKTRIQQILATRVIEKYPRIFVGVDSEINLKPNVVAYVVSQLQRFSLLASAVDVKGIAYEEVVGSNLRGDRGEFFTPRNACRMAVTMLDPQPSERLIDPACGTGGFLITAMNHALEQLDMAERGQWTDPAKPNDFERHELFRKHTDYFANNVAGLDLNPALVRAAKMNMVMNNDGEGGLFQANSLANPHAWSEEATERIQLGSIDVLFTNPPFGANIVIDEEPVLEQYDLAARWDRQEDGSWKMRLDARGAKVLQKSQPPEILFIERCVQFLVEGSGRMAMVIPNGILNNPALGYVRQWMLQNTQIIAVVDMDRDLFQPKNDTQTSMVLMRRLSADERELAAKGKLDYPVFMAVTHKIGHDKRGKTIYRRTETGEDLLVLRTEETVVTDIKTGEERIVKTQVKDKVIDDELPEVATAFRAWLAEHP
jgi:type I restriction enzyme M protein